MTIILQKKYTENIPKLLSCVNGNLLSIKHNLDAEDIYCKLKKDIEELKDEISATKNSIISTLLSLRTIKKVIESFPDAAPYAEAYQKKSCTAVALPIKNISDILKKYSK